MDLRRIFLKFLCSPRPVDLHHSLANTVFELAAQKGYGEPGTGWACDRKAYEAMTTDNYETDIFLYQNGL